MIINTMMTYLQNILHTITAWQTRMITLAVLVLFVGGSSQALVSAFAAHTEQVTRSASASTTRIVADDTFTPSCSIIVRPAPAGVAGRSSATHHAFVLRCPPKGYVVLAARYAYRK